MATQYLTNPIRLLRGLFWPGTPFDSVNDAALIAQLQAAGGVLAGGTTVAAAAVIAQQVKARAGLVSDAADIMHSAVAAAQSAAPATLPTLSRAAHFRLPTATGTDMSTATAKADSQAKAPSAHLAYPANVQVVTSGWTSTAAVAVVLTGTDVHGKVVSETVTIPTGGTTQQSLTAWVDSPTITSWTTPAGWTAGTFKQQAGTKVGLPAQPGSTVAVLKESGYTDGSTAGTYTASTAPANATVGTVDGANATYVPATALDGAHSFDVWYTEAPPAHSHPVQ